MKKKVTKKVVKKAAAKQPPPFDYRNTLSAAIHRKPDGSLISGYMTPAGFYDELGSFIGKIKPVDSWFFGSSDVGRIFPFEDATAAWVRGVGLKVGFDSVASAQAYVDSVRPRNLSPA